MQRDRADGASDMLMTMGPHTLAALFAVVLAITGCDIVAAFSGGDMQGAAPADVPLDLAVDGDTVGDGPAPDGDAAWVTDATFKDSGPSEVGAADLSQSDRAGDAPPSDRGPGDSTPGDSTPRDTTRDSSADVGVVFDESVPCTGAQSLLFFGSGKGKVVVCIGPVVASFTVCDALNLCNVAAGWRPCSLGQYYGAGGDSNNKGIVAWIDACVARPNGTVIDPYANAAATCGCTGSGSQATTGLQCGAAPITTIAAAGVTSDNACHQLGPSAATAPAGRYVARTVDDGSVLNAFCCGPAVPDLSP